MSLGEGSPRPSPLPLQRRDSAASRKGGAAILAGGIAGSWEESRSRFVLSQPGNPGKLPLNSTNESDTTYESMLNSTRY
jgi:hypothetical protein